MLLSYHNLVDLVSEGIITANPNNINGASIDITLGDEIMVETNIGYKVDIAKKECLNMRKVKMAESGYVLNPGDFILASSVETFNLPNFIAAEYKLKSSLARTGLQHMLAGWCDPGWNNSKLTLELYNVTRKHPLVIRPGMKIGQMIFMRCEPVPEDQSYATKGQYNGQQTVTENKGVR